MPGWPAIPHFLDIKIGLGSDAVNQSKSRFMNTFATGDVPDLLNSRNVY